MDRDSKLMWRVWSISAKAAGERLLGEYLQPHVHIARPGRLVADDFVVMAGQVFPHPRTPVNIFPR